MTLFEQIKATKKQDYQRAYQMARDNAIQAKQHGDSVTFYAVTGEFLTFKVGG